MKVVIIYIRIFPGWFGTNGWYQVADCVNNIGIQVGAAYFNMWIIFSSEGPLDIVLNGLAMEFLAVADEEVFSQIMGRFPKIADDIKRVSLPHRPEKQTCVTCSGASPFTVSI